jgi:hypothetical protein
LPVISTKGLVAKDVSELMEKTRTLMVKEFYMTNKEVQS